MIPNLLSAARIVVSILLLAVRITSPWFILAYLSCGASDVLDGLLARRWQAETKTGKLLDTAGDLAFSAVVLVVFVKNFTVPLWLIAWVGVIGVVRIAAWMISNLRLHTIIVHTYLDRAAGVALFGLLPIVLLTGCDIKIASAAVCVICSIASLEVLALSILLTGDKTDVHSLFGRLKQSGGSGKDA